MRAPRTAALGFHILLCLASFLVATDGIGAEGQEAGREQAWLVFAGTESPDGRYAVAWGLPKHPGIWAEICRSFRDQTQRKFEDDEKIEIPEDDVENYIVDLREEKVLAQLGSNRQLVSNYWHLPHLRPNRHHLDVVCSRASDIVIVNHVFRWQRVMFCAVRMSNGKVVDREDLSQVFGRLLEARFARSLRKSGFSKEVVSFAFSEIDQLQDGTFSTDVAATVPSKSAESWDESAVIHFTLLPSGESGLTVKVLEIRTPTTKPVKNPVRATHALAIDYFIRWTGLCGEAPHLPGSVDRGARLVRAPGIRRPPRRWRCNRASAQIASMFSPLSAAHSQARAALQSRITVLTCILRTSAISSIVRPPK